MATMGVRPLPPQLAEKAKLVLNEDPKKMADSIQHMKEWIAKQPHLRARTDDQWLAAFLRGCKFSLERTKEKIDLFYSLRSIAPEMRSLKYSDPKFMEILKLGVFLVLPKVANPADPRVFLMRGGAYPAEKYSIFDIMMVGAAIQNILYLEDDNFMVAGGEMIMDFKDATVAHMTQMNPVVMKKMVVAGQDAAPTRMKGAHYLNTPPGFETFFNIAKNFLNEKNRNRLHVHGKNYDALYQHISKDILPTEFGGNGGSVQDITDYWVKKIQEYSAWFEEDQGFGTDEARRPGKPKTAEDMFGVDGSFRQLQFD